MAALTGRPGAKKAVFVVTVCLVVLNLLLYISFFPQLIAGPIVRYSTIEEEILHRQESWADVEAGLKRFIVGLSKKVLLANNVAVFAEMVYRGDPSVYGTAMY